MTKFEIDFSEEFSSLPSAPIAEAVIHWRARSENPLEDVLGQLKEKLPNY